MIEYKQIIADYTHHNKLLNKIKFYDFMNHGYDPVSNLLDKDFANGMIRSLCIGGEINIVTTEVWFSQETKEFFSSLKEVDPFIPDEKHKTVMELCYSPNILNRMAFRKEE